MLTVEQLIADLLLQHNCVIVPGFGGFVAQRLPAQIDIEKGQVHPPKKSILFNQKEKMKRKSLKDKQTA